MKEWSDSGFRNEHESAKFQANPENPDPNKVRETPIKIEEMAECLKVRTENIRNLVATSSFSGFVRVLLVKTQEAKREADCNDLRMSRVLGFILAQTKTAIGK